MKIGIAGAGAVGCHYGAMLQKAGLDVVFLARGDHLAAMQTDGLIHTTAGETQQLSVQASDDAAILTACEIVLLTCKTTVLDELCHQIAPHLRPDAVLVTLQNGVHAPDVVAEAFSGHAVIAASAFIGVRIDVPGTVIHSAAGYIRLGPWQGNGHGAATQPLRELTKVFQDAGVDAEMVPDMRSMLWNKLLWNGGFNAMTALTRRYARDLVADEGSVQWVRKAMEEMIQVAATQGVTLPDDAIEKHIALTLQAGPVKTSMWQDIERQRPTEIDDMNGYIATIARAEGIDAPVNAMLASLIRAVEGGYS